MQDLTSLWGLLGCTYFHCLNIGDGAIWDIYIGLTDRTWDLRQSCSHLAWELEAGGILQDILHNPVLLCFVNIRSTENGNDTTKDFK